MTALAHYREAFAQLPGLDPRERAARAAALDHFIERGFPTRREEEWKYTDLSALAQKSFSPAVPAPSLPALPAFAATRRVIFANGALQPGALPGGVAVLTAAAPDGEQQPVGLLNAAFARAGVQLDLPDGQALAEPLHVVAWSGAHAGAAMSHLRHRLRLGERAQATVVLHEISDASPQLCTQVCDIELAAGASLTLYRLQEYGSSTSALGRIDARLGRDSRLQAVTVDLGGGLARNDLNVSLAEPGASVELHGFYSPPAAAHTDNHTCIAHRAPHCRSFEHYRGVMTRGARAVFNGRIVVHEGAQKTDSEQRVANLLLAPGAEVNAKPELEIYADDVKCAHGATTGRLDEQAIFYLRSRGLGEAAARALLTVSFAEEVLGHIALPALKQHVEAAFAARLNP